MKNYFTCLFILLVVGLALSTTAWGQIAITNSNPVTQNFDAMLGTSATAALTTNQWRAASNSVAATWAAANLTATTLLGGTAAAVTSGGFYNYGDGVAASATDRALGFLSSGTAPWPGTSTTPLNIYAQYSNSSGGTITQLSGSFDIEKYRGGTNAAGWSIGFFYSLDGSTWTAVTSGNHSFAADAGNTAVSPAGSYPKTFTISGLNIANGSYIYLRWTYFVTTGSTATNAQGLGIDNVSVTATIDVSVPAINVSSSTLTGFSYAQGSGPSASQSYNLSGSNLTPTSGNLTVTGSTNYEVSTDNSNFSGSVNVAYIAGALASTPIHVRLKSELSAGTYNGELIANSGGDATTQNVTVNGSVTATEPANHSTSFGGAVGTPAFSKITLTWTDAAGAIVPDGYLVRASTVSYADITNPVDGTPVTDALLVRNVTQGTQTVSFTELSGGTTYYFKIFSYRGSGATINYKTDGTVEQASVATAVLPLNLLFEHNFDYSGNIADYGWSLHSGSGSPINTTTGLSYDGYPSSGIGNAANVTGAADDVNYGFAEQNVNGTSIFLSALLNVTESANDLAGSYFLHLGDRVSSSNFILFSPRIFARVDVSGNVNFGLSVSGVATWGAENFTKNTTYLLVVKYTINTTGNDEAKMWIMSSGVPADETAAGASLITVNAELGQDVIDAIGIRQATGIPDVVIDGIRIATSWGQAPLPVQLASFVGNFVSNNQAKLEWTTISEINNYGFYVERRAASEEQFTTVSDLIPGAGYTLEPQYYTWTDESAVGNEIQYRLKQIDNDGLINYHGPITVSMNPTGVQETEPVPAVFKLNQNYPNPFNPSTIINYQLSIDNYTTLKVYNLIGKEVATLFSGNAEAGRYNFEFRTSDFGLSSGIYFYKLQSGSSVEVRKLTLIK